MRALVTGIVSALQMGIQKRQVQEDSKLVIQQVKEEFSLKEGALASYHIVVQNLTKLFLSIQFEHIPRSHNKHAMLWQCWHPKSKSGITWQQ